MELITELIAQSNRLIELKLTSTYIPESMVPRILSHKSNLRVLEMGIHNRHCLSECIYYYLPQSLEFFSVDVMSRGQPFEIVYGSKLEKLFLTTNSYKVLITCSDIDENQQCNSMSIHECVHIVSSLVELVISAPEDSIRMIWKHLSNSSLRPNLLQSLHLLTNGCSEQCLEPIIISDFPKLIHLYSGIKLCGSEIILRNLPMLQTINSLYSTLFSQPITTINYLEFSVLEKIDIRGCNFQILIDSILSLKYLRVDSSNDNTMIHLSNLPNLHTLEVRCMLFHSMNTMNLSCINLVVLYCLLPSDTESINCMTNFIQKCFCLETVTLMGTPQGKYSLYDNLFHAIEKLPLLKNLILKHSIQKTNSFDRTIFYKLKRILTSNCCGLLY